MVQIEIDGKPVEVSEGTMVMEAAKMVGTHIPHFCYHKKLSIAANCRMCLVEVEKAPKPLPACATPVNPGMKVHTHSEKAVQAQKSVMEFLLINHPLDCPICDQGGECQLQDLAVGYGKTTSRYQEEKRVVFHKNVGPLISMEEMSRCIHCTRCVRFGQEIGGVMELGMLGRGEHSEITSFVGQNVDSEMSGNMIDLCPVGALTSKPFRYSARTWELGRKKSLSPHDSLGSNIVIQTKSDQVKRIVPLENETINECWISDKDRFAYEGLTASDRITKPLVKQDGKWIETDWEPALDYVVRALKGVAQDHGANAIASVAHPMSTLEELFLLKKLTKSMGSSNIETRLRQQDVSGAAKAPWLGMQIEDVAQLDRVLIIGSFFRKDQPVFASRLRQWAKRGLQISRVDAGGDDWLMNVPYQLALAPTNWVAALGGIAAAIAKEKGIAAPAGVTDFCEKSAAIAKSLVSGQKQAIFLGSVAQAHPEYAQLHAWAQFIAEQTGATLGLFAEGANTVGAHLVDAVSEEGIQKLISAERKAFILLNVEPNADLLNPLAARSALEQASTVIALTPFASEEMLEIADVILPITPYTETSGTYINTAGTAQTVHASVRPAGQSRPAWKVLRVLGSLLGFDGFSFNSSEEVKEAALPANIQDLLSNRTSIAPAAPSSAAKGLERLADVPIHFTDAIVRRASALRLTRDSKRALQAGIPAGLFAQLNLKEGDAVRVTQNSAQVVMPATMQKGLAEGVVRISAGTEASALLGEMFGTLTVERA